MLFQHSIDPMLEKYSVHDGFFNTVFHLSLDFKFYMHRDFLALVRELCPLADKLTHSRGFSN